MRGKACEILHQARRGNRRGLGPAWERDGRLAKIILAENELPQPGWRNWQTHRTQNPPGFGPWGFDPPSRHQGSPAISWTWGRLPAFHSGRLTKWKSRDRCASSDEPSFANKRLK